MWIPWIYLCLEDEIQIFNPKSPTDFYFVVFEKWVIYLNTCFFFFSFGILQHKSNLALIWATPTMHYIWAYITNYHIQTYSKIFVLYSCKTLFKSRKRWSTLFAYKIDKHFHCVSMSSLSTSSFFYSSSTR